MPTPGEVVRLTRTASPQFAQTVTLRLTKVAERQSSVSGWAWLEGYVLDARGNAVNKRTVFVNLAGL